MRTLGLAGMSVTTPHKADVIAALDDATDDARRLGAVNCIATDDAGRLIGHNTDGAGFVRGLADDFGFDPRGASCVVLGAGGAARAVILALARAGAARVVVVNRTEERAVAASDLADSAGSVGGPEAIAIGRPGRERDVRGHGRRRRVAPVRCRAPAPRTDRGRTRVPAPRDGAHASRWTSSGRVPPTARRCWCTRARSHSSTGPGWPLPSRRWRTRCPTHSQIGRPGLPEPAPSEVDRDIFPMASRYGDQGSLSSGRTEQPSM